MTLPIDDATSRALEAALDLRFQRQRLLTANVAHADTPGYQPVDLAFEGALRQAMEAGEAGPPGMARTDAAHLPGAAGAEAATDEVVVRPDVTNTLDGNGVDLDLEMARLTDNRLRYEVTAEAMRRRVSRLLTIISTLGQ